MKNTTLLISSKDILPSVSTKLRDQGDHFAVTFYKDLRKNLALSKGDLVILEIAEQELIRQVYPDYHITLPKKLLSNEKHDEQVILPILKIIKTKDGEKRSENAFFENKLDIRHFIPTKTAHGTSL